MICENLSKDDNHKYYMRMIEMNYKHYEAYCLMTYKCDKCNKDERVLNRVPEDEERVFSTMTYKDKKRMAKERADNLIKIGYKKPKDKNKLIKQLIREYNEEHNR